MDAEPTVLDHLVTACLVLAGLVHLLPLPSLLGGAALRRLYGVSVEDRNILIMLQHRAVLFGLLGAALVAAAFRPEFQLVATTAGVVSTVSFLAIAIRVGGYNAQISRVVVADVLAIVALVTAAAVGWVS